MKAIYEPGDFLDTGEPNWGERSGQIVEITDGVSYGDASDPLRDITFMDGVEGLAHDSELKHKSETLEWPDQPYPDTTAALDAKREAYQVESMLTEMRALGYAAVAWSPEELAGREPSNVEAHAKEHGDDYIHSA